MATSAGHPADPASPAAAAAPAVSASTRRAIAATDRDGPRATADVDVPENERGLTERQRNILRMIRDHAPLQPREIAQQLVISIHAVGPDVRTLVGRRLIRARGDGRLELDPST